MEEGREGAKESFGDEQGCCWAGPGEIGWWLRTGGRCEGKAGMWESVSRRDAGAAQGPTSECITNTHMLSCFSPPLSVLSPSRH